MEDCSFLDVMRCWSVEQKRAFLASKELCYDPLYQPSMDTAWHYWMQDKYKKARVWFDNKLKEDNNVEMSRVW